ERGWGEESRETTSKHRQLHLAPVSCPSTPSTYQLMLSIALSSSDAPAATFVLPSCPLMGPENTANFPALMSAFFASTAFFAASGTMLLMLTKSFMPSLIPPHTVVFKGLPDKAASATLV